MLRSLGPGDPAAALAELLGPDSAAAASRELLVAWAERGPDAIAAAAARLGPSSGPRELVLLHRGGARPQGSRARRLAAGARRVHHLRLAVADDRDALARDLAGRSVSLVLSGGGARGLAHVGVIRALREANVAIDAVAGSSAGGGVAVLLAAGFEPAAMVDSIKDVWIDSGVFRRIAGRPRRSLLDAGALRPRVEAWLGALELDDLWRECFVIAANLSRRRAELIDAGPAVEAILATSAIPGLLPPVERDRELLADGGLVDNLPVEPMLARRPGFVIASDVRVRGRFAAGPRERGSTRGSSGAPSSLASVLGAAALTWARAARPPRAAAIGALLRPSLPRVAPLAFEDPWPLIEAGYRCAIAAIEAGALDPVLARRSSLPRSNP